MVIDSALPRRTLLFLKNRSGDRGLPGDRLGFAEENTSFLKHSVSNEAENVLRHD